MMDMNNIQQFFPEAFRTEKSYMLREYLQYEILKLIFEGKYAHKFTFLGGTCLRICYGTTRFSEDLDFDNVVLTREEFEESCAAIQRGLELLGYEVALRFAYKGAFHCNIRFPALLFKYQLSGHKEAKLLIKMDTEKQHYDYERAFVPINKFGVRTEVPAVPLNLLASMKVAAIMGRKRPKGRDYYDLVWILGQTTPDYGYLIDRFEVDNSESLRQMVQERIGPFDFAALASDVRPFLFAPEEIDTVEQFPNFWKTARLA
jgi:predicted nucleotidyltransferase component of viral defense system